MSSEKGTGSWLVGGGFAAGFLLGAASAWMLRWGAITGSAFLSGFQCGRQAADDEPQVGYGCSESKQPEEQSTAEQRKVEEAARKEAEEAEAWRELLTYNAETAYGAKRTGVDAGSESG